MVSSLLVDALADPSSVIDSLYEDYKNDKQKETPDFPSLVSRHFSRVFESVGALSQINLLTPSSIASSSSHTRPALVHFRGMVQDTSPSPEVYLASHSGKTYGWGLDLSRHPLNDEEHESAGMGPGLFGEGNENLAERTVLWAVSIPGETEWSVERAGKGASDVVENLAENVNNISLSKSSHASSLQHKFPVPETAHVALRVKLYESSGESLKPTNLVSFVGILTHEELDTEDISLSYTPSQTGSSSSPPHTTPVLHVLFHKPIVDGVILSQYPHSAYSDSLRKEVIQWIADQGLGGDVEAAEWVLLACLSNVQSRSPPLLPLSLTLSGFPRASNSSSPTSLSHVLSQLLPLHSNIPLTLDYLNRHGFEPESKHEDLHAGVLQLPPKTVVLVSDLGMKEGKLEQKGLQNLQALQDVIARQTLRYNFPYSNFALQTDMNFIVLAEGKKCAFCETTVSIPLVPRHTEPSRELYKSKDAIQLPPVERLNAFREFIASARTGKVTISEDISKFIQDSFVSERQTTSSKSFGPDDLVRRMTVAKLVALSRHQGSLTEETWREAVTLDGARVSRIV